MVSFVGNFQAELLFGLLCIVCVASECGDPPVVTQATNNIIGEPPYAEGTLVNYTCAAGYERQGNPSYTCTGGQWTGGNLQCHPTSCGQVDAPENGYISNQPDYVAGTSITFECNPGYDLVGRASLVCLVTGEWNPSDLPTCNIKKCPDFPTIANSQIFQDTIQHEANTYGSVVEVTCDSGYVINGNIKVRCNEEGNWEDIPRCERVNCGTHPGLNSSCIEYTYLGDGILFITCDDHATLVGGFGGSDDCNEDTSQWNHPDMTCKCGCLISQSENVLLENTDSNGYLKHGDILNWVCEVGDKNTSDNLQCQDGVIEAPGCLETTTRVTTTAVLQTQTAETSTTDLGKQDIETSTVIQDSSPILELTSTRSSRADSTSTYMERTITEAPKSKSTSLRPTSTLKEENSTDISEENESPDTFKDMSSTLMICGVVIGLLLLLVCLIAFVINKEILLNKCRKNSPRMNQIKIAESGVSLMNDTHPPIVNVGVKMSACQDLDEIPLNEAVKRKSVSN